MLLSHLFKVTCKNEKCPQETTTTNLLHSNKKVEYIVVVLNLTIRDLVIMLWYFAPRTNIVSDGERKWGWSTSKMNL